MIFFFSLGPMVRSWCMRYEAKHRYFKQLAGILGNFTNVAYSLAMRHQRLQCLKVDSLGAFCSDFLHKPVEIGTQWLYDLLLGILSPCDHRK